MSVRIKDLTFAYKSFILRIGELQFGGGRVATIVGPNGAGKTTLLKCVGAILPVRKGTLFVDGKDIAGLKSQERARLVSYVPQEHGSAFNYLVIDFVLMGRAAYVPLFSVPSREDVRIAEEALDFVGLGRFAERTYAELSSGERRLVLIARALAQQSDIFLLDEPTTFLDPKHERELLNLIRKLATEKKKTILLTLHNLEMTLEYSDDMVFMKNGQVVAWGQTEEVFKEPLLKAVYETEMKVVEWNGRKIILR
ncbi:MAG: ABC transporter ATP-binding protein [Candidatus Aminicenantales bacterium]